MCQRGYVFFNMAPRPNLYYFTLPLGSRDASASTGSEAGTRGQTQPVIISGEYIKLLWIWWTSSSFYTRPNKCFSERQCIAWYFGIIEQKLQIATYFSKTEAWEDPILSHPVWYWMTVSYDSRLEEYWKNGGIHYVNGIFYSILTAHSTRGIVNIAFDNLHASLVHIAILRHAFAFPIKFPQAMGWMLCHIHLVGSRPEMNVAGLVKRTADAFDGISSRGAKHLE